MEERIRYVYKVFDKLNEDKFYIGTTFDIEKRWKEHKKDSNSHKLKADMSKYGGQDFDIEIVFSGEENEVYAEEVRLIAKLKPYYNNKGDVGGKWGNGNIGENNPRAKLIRQDILDICDRVVVNGESVQSVAKDYPHVIKGYLYKIVNGKAWEHIKEAPRRSAGEVNIKGENHGRAKLVKQDILDICDRVVVNGEHISEVAKDYPQVTEDLISKIIRGDLWDHVTEAPRRRAGGVDTKGENHGNAKLVKQDIIDICDRVVVNGESVIDVAKDYPQVTQDYIYEIVSGEVRQEVKEAPRRKVNKRLTKEEVLDIRILAFEGETPKDIQKHCYSNKTVKTIKEVIVGKSFNKYEGPQKGRDY